MSDAADPAPDDAITAAEYVLRLLPDDEQGAFEDRLRGSQDLRNRTRWWEARFADLADDIVPVTVRPQVRARLMRSLFGEPTKLFPNRIGLWRALNLVSLSVVAFLAYQLFNQPAPPVQGPLLLGEISAADDLLRVLASYDSQTGEIRVVRAEGAALPGRVLQLWAIEGESAPVSLGVLSEQSDQVVSLPQALRAGDIASIVLAISDEPPGGSPTGLPTGAVVATGSFTDL